MPITIPYLATDSAADALTRSAIAAIHAFEPSIRFEALPLGALTDAALLARLLGPQRVMLGRHALVSRTCGLHALDTTLSAYARKWVVRSFAPLDPLPHRGMPSRLATTLICDVTGAARGGVDKTADYALRTAHIKNDGRLLLVRDEGSDADAGLAEALETALARYPGTRLEHVSHTEVVTQLVRDRRMSAVLVTHARVGELLAAVLAGLVGGAPYMPAAILGTAASVFGPCELGRESAAALDDNPASVLLSCAVLLRYIGETQLAARIDALGDRTILEMNRVPELGWSAPPPSLPVFDDAARAAIAHLS